VKVIGYWAFNYCSSLKKVNIPENCEWIGQYAFWGSRLSEIHIPASMKWIDGDALPGTLRKITVDAENPVYYAVDNVMFRYDGTLFCYAGEKAEEAYVVPDGVKEIGEYAFRDAGNLKSVILPDGVESIGYSAFSGCMNLWEMSLPDSVVRIEEGAFWDCRSLAKLVIPASVQTMDGDLILANVEGTVIFGTKGTVAEQWASDHRFAFVDMNVPWNLSGSCGDGVNWSLSEDGVLQVTGKGKMNDYAYGQHSPWYQYANMIRKAIVSEGVDSIGAYAFFENKNMTSVELPESLMTIESHAISRCESLTTVAVPENVTYIAPFAFSSCERLERIMIPGSDTQLDIQVFEYCRDFVIFCREGSYAEQYAEWEDIECETYCADASLRIPDFATAIESQAFGNVGAVLVHIPGCVTRIADDAFDEGTIIFAPSGSYAEEWAEDNGFACFAE